MFITVAQELEEKTRAFWNLSSVWNGKHQQEIETGEAIEVCSTILNMTNFTRPLSFMTDRLLNDIIRGEESELRHVAEIIPLRQRI